MLSSPSSFKKHLISESLQSEKFDFISSVLTFLESKFPKIKVSVIEHNNSLDCFHVKNSDDAGNEYKQKLKSAARKDFLEKESFFELSELLIVPLRDGEEYVDYLLITPLQQASKYKDFLEYCAQIQDVYQLIKLDREYQSLVGKEQSAHLMSQMSHDINSLLNLIPEECLQNERFKAKVDYTEKISREIIYYLRGLPVDMIRVPVKELFEGITKGIGFPETIDFSLNVIDQFDFVVVDVELIDRAMRAILTNAIFATNIDGGRIRMTLKKRKSTSPFINNDWLEVSVADSGPGIPDEFLPEVSKPFFTTWKDFGYAGLGLPIAEMIINAHKGKLSIKNNSGAGAIVTILIPINDDNTKE